MDVRRLPCLLLVMLLTLIATTTSFAADNVVHYIVPLNGTTDTFPAGPEAACFGDADTATLTLLVERGELRITEVVAGPNEGSMHGVSTNKGTVTVVTDRATYTGDWSETINIKFHRSDQRGLFSEHLRVAGPNRDEVQVNFHYQFTVKDGQVTRELYKVACAK